MMTINGQLKSNIRTLMKDPLVWLFLALLVVGASLSPYFLSTINVENVLRNSSVIGFLALGVTLVLITGRIDLSIAVVMIFSMFTTIIICNEIGAILGERWLVRRGTFVGPTSLLVLVALATGAIVGAVNGIGVAYLKISSFIMTLVALTGLRGVNMMLTKGQPYYLRGDGINWLGDGLLFGLPVGFAFLILSMTAVWLFLTRTVVGKYFYAIGGNETAIRYAGVKTEKIVVLAFTLSGFFSAMAGVLVTMRLKSVDATLGTGYELTAIGIAVVAGVSLAGGIGSPVRTVFAAILLSSALNLMALLGYSSRIQNLAVGAVLIVGVGIAQYLSSRNRSVAIYAKRES